MSCFLSLMFGKLRYKCNTFLLGERVSLSITIILAMTVFMFIVADKVPPNSDSLPLIGIFYFACMVEEALCLVAVCYTLSLYYTDPQLFNMPSWVRWVIADWSGKLLGINLDIRQRHSLMHMHNLRKEMLEKRQITKHTQANGCGNEMNSGGIVTMPPSGHIDDRRKSRPSRGEWIPAEESEVDYWKLAAMIADRIMFIVFLITISVTFIVLFARVSQECKN